MISTFFFALIISAFNAQENPNLRVEESIHPDTIRCMSPYCANQNLQLRLNDTLVPELFIPCSEIDIGNYFTPCENKKKHLIQYYKAPSMCDPEKGKKLHSPLELDCDFSFCPTGEYLSVDN